MCNNNKWNHFHIDNRDTTMKGHAVITGQWDTFFNHLFQSTLLMNVHDYFIYYGT